MQQFRGKQAGLETAEVYKKILGIFEESSIILYRLYDASTSFLARDLRSIIVPRAKVVASSSESYSSSSLP